MVGARPLDRCRCRRCRGQPQGVWLGLDLAVSVASGTGRFPVDATGPALWCISPRMLCPASAIVSPLCAVTAASICPASTWQVVTGDRLRLDTERDQFALAQTVHRIRPALLLLDPLVRLHSLDASDISSLLGFLRAINGRYQLALILVHHMAKRSRRNLGQSLRKLVRSACLDRFACYLVGAPTTVCYSPSSTAPLPLQTPSCCASPAAATSLSR